MRNIFFVTGTDTGVGKTSISAALLHSAASLGKSTLGLKPIAAGCELIDGQLRNDDALLLQSQSTIKIPYEQINPIALKEPLAPHIAAAQEGKRLTVNRVVGYVRGALTNKSDLAIIEGAGGWRVPLNQVETTANMVKELNLPVILVVGLRLGCINHAILTAESIVNDGLTIAGWIANSVIPEMDAQQENINTLRAIFRFPLLAEVPYLSNDSPEEIGRYLSIGKLLSGP